MTSRIIKMMLFLSIMSLTNHIVCGKTKAKKVTTPKTETKPAPAPVACQTKKGCLNDPNCPCWCSVICEYRDKKDDDRPVFVDNDPNGKFCYCKAWDKENYKERQCDVIPAGTGTPMGKESAAQEMKKKEKQPKKAKGMKAAKMQKMPKTEMPKQPKMETTKETTMMPAKKRMSME